MLVKVKNRTAYPVLLKDISGETNQLNPNVVKDIDDSFLIDYDTTAITVVQKKQITITNILDEQPKVAPATTSSPKSKDTTPKSNN
jgi:hypothetical protein